MGEHKRKLTHSIDAVVASETHQFDSLAEPDPVRKEALEKLVLQMSRARSLVRVFIPSPGGPAAIVEEIYIQKMLARAELVVQSQILEKVLKALGLPPEDIVQQTADQMERMLDMEQIANKLLITPDGVFKD